MGKKMKKTNGIYLLSLLLVVCIWGISPTVSKWLLGYYSPTVKTAVSSFIAFSSILVISIATGRIKKLEKKYFATAAPTGIFYSSACIMQSIGLSHASPAISSFFENLSCLVVPLIVWAMTKKRPTFFKLISAVLCLLSVYILSCSDGLTSFSFGVGEMLCAIAGIFYGVNIAVTGIRAKGLDPLLYLLVQFGVHMSLSSVFAAFYGTPKFTFSVLPLAAMIGVVLVSTVFGWVVRTVCLTHLDPVLVTVIMPFSSVITTVISVIVGMDELSWTLIVGAAVGVTAVMICDINLKPKPKPKPADNKTALESRTEEAQS